MTEFNISHLMFTGDAMPTRRRKYESFTDMIAWVESHIGPTTEKNSFTAPVIRKGPGWEIRTTTIKKGDAPGSMFKVISWRMHIEDEQLATMFALKFVK